LEAECRVAPFDPITRTYISHGWNCKHCRNCQYAWGGVLKDPQTSVESEVKIRGPCIIRYKEKKEF